MIPGDDEYLSCLMGASDISDNELLNIGVRIVRGAGSGFRKLLIPDTGVAAYKAMVREKITPGYWTEIIGRKEIFFVFKMDDGTVQEFSYSEANRERIASLCTALNNDPIEKTSDLLNYLAANSFYRETMIAFHKARYD